MQISVCFEGTDITWSTNRKMTSLPCNLIMLNSNEVSYSACTKKVINLYSKLRTLIILIKPRTV